MLLQTPVGRISVPRVSGLQRPRLFALLDEVLDARLGMVVAPAGAGKTTLLAHWAAHVRADVAWYRADESDGDTDTFIRRLGEALAAISPERPRAHDLHSLVAAVQQDESPLVLVVDDLHLVDHLPVAHLLQQLALAAPPRLTLMLASRRTPGLNLARTEMPTVLVNEDELSFRPSETGELFRAIYHRPLSESASERLTRQTGGWAAGMRLFHLTQPTDTVPGRGEVPTADIRYAASYLHAQVLTCVPEHLIGFLRATSCFEGLTPVRCDNLLGSHDSRRMLVQLARCCDMVRSDDGGLTYRVHPALRRHLETEFLDETPRASALRHYRRAASLLDCGDDAAARMFARVAHLEPLGGRSVPQDQTLLREPVAIRCFGRFQITVDGEEPQWRGVRPRARALLRLLALEAGRSVHRDVLLDALWPDLDPASGAHNLHVSVSSLRAALEPGAPRGASRILVREGEGYRLALPPGSFCDLAEFDRLVAEANHRRATGRPEDAVTALEAALALASAEVLTEDGPVDWVVSARDRYQCRVAEAAATLAELHLARRDPGAAAASARRSLEADPCRDASWRILLAAYDASGDLAAAQRARRSYADVLVSLGVGRRAS